MKDLIEGKLEFRTILDINNQLSKSDIKNLLLSAKIYDMIRLPESNSFIFIENEISIGMYHLRLGFHSLEEDRERSCLKDYGGFKVYIYEKIKKELHTINLNKDKRFKDQYWVTLNDKYKLKVNQLTDIIIYINRLNTLKSFL